MEHDYKGVGGTTPRTGEVDCVGNRQSRITHGAVIELPRKPEATMDVFTAFSRRDRPISVTISPDTE